MFDAVRNNQKIVQVFLALITLPFAFFGIESYMNKSGAGNDVARVGDTKITTQQFEQAMRERQDQLRQSMGEAFRPEMLNSPDARLSVLNSLIDRRLLLLESSKDRMTVSDAALIQEISGIPALQENGKFSLERYDRLLNAQGMTKQQFESMFRQDLAIQQLMGAINGTAFVAQPQIEAFINLQFEGREYSEFRIGPEQFAAQVKLDGDAARKYYDEHKAQFETPEQIKIDYLVLSPDALLPQVSVSEAEVKAAYDANKDKYKLMEERRASHILISVKDGDDKAAARAKAEEVLKEARKTPAKFAALAKKHSQDPGSAQSGGDLGYFGRGMMVKPFEDAVYVLKEGEISDVLESEFGFHIIKLTGIKAATFEEVRSDVERELRSQVVMRKFAESAETFGNTVYEQSDSLQPAADHFKLKLQHSEWIQKNPSPQAMAALGPLANEKALAALFSDDAIKNKRNIEAVEIAPNTLLSARVTAHEPATMKPFESVKNDIEKQIKADEAAKLAAKAGEARLTALEKGETASESGKISWSAPRTASRMQRGNLPAEALRAIFKADIEKLPAYVGADVNGGYTIYKIVKRIPPESFDEGRRQALQNEYAGILAQEDFSAYVSALRLRYKIDINKSLLESREH